MNSLLTFDLLLVLVIVGLLIVTVSCAVFERPPASSRYYPNKRMASTLPDHVAYSGPIQL